VSLSIIIPAKNETGARAETGKLIVFMHGDGQHHAHELLSLLQHLDDGTDTAIGARKSGSHMNVGRFINMNELFVSAAVGIFLIGLISEQITALTFSKS